MMSSGIPTPSLEDAAAHLANFMDNFNLNNEDPVLSHGNTMNFEISWEVANKVGTVYSVLRSKAARTVAELGRDNYVLVGALSDNAWSEVEEGELSPLLDETVQALREEHGIDLLVGTWFVEGSPQVILFNLESVNHAAAEWCQELEKDQQIAIPKDDKVSQDTVIFGVCTTLLFQEYRKRCPASQQITCVLHDWMASPAIAFAHNRGIPMPSVFVEHAPLLSRYLCEGPTGNAAAMLENLESLSPEKEAARLGITHRFALERLAVQHCTVLGAVSHCTALETHHFLGRKPSVLLPNGINVNKFAALHELQNKHAEAKAKIHDFVLGHFHGYGHLTSGNTLYFFSGGRYEFRNKGTDVLLESLARLNMHLKSTNSPLTVVMFLLFPRDSSTYNQESLVAQGVTNQLRDTVQVIEERIAAKILNSAYAGKMPDFDTLLDAQDELMLKRCILLAQRDKPPPISTHVIKKSASDPIITTLARLSLNNERDDRVKIIFHPRFLSKSNPLFGIDYEDFVRGCHLGVFPSLYEPWGYTPGETAVLGVPVVTSDLSGFGGHVLEAFSSDEESQAAGVYMVKRRGRTDEDAITQLTNHLVSFCALSRKQRIMLRNSTEQNMSSLLDWASLCEKYSEARKAALA